MCSNFICWRIPSTKFENFSARGSIWCDHTVKTTPPTHKSQDVDKMINLCPRQQTHSLKIEFHWKSPENMTKSRRAIHHTPSFNFLHVYTYLAEKTRCLHVSPCFWLPNLSFVFEQKCKFDISMENICVLQFHPFVSISNCLIWSFPIFITQQLNALPLSKSKKITIQSFPSHK